jgi:hypothetical protein
MLIYSGHTVPLHVSSLIDHHQMASKYNKFSVIKLQVNVQTNLYKTDALYNHKLITTLSMQRTVEAHRIVRRRGSHIFLTTGSQMAMRFSALRAGRLLAPKKIPGTYFS